MFHQIKDKNKQQIKVVKIEENGDITFLAKVYKDKSRWKLEVFKEKQFVPSGSFTSKKKAVELMMELIDPNNTIYNNENEENDAT